MSNNDLPINLGDLIHQRVIESERVEFKASWNARTKAEVVRTISAFANDLLNTNGGYIIIGIEEKNGKPVLPPRGIGEANPDTIQKEIIGACKGSIVPEYLPMIFFTSFQDGEIIVIWCPAGENRPYQAPSRKGGDMVYWIRPSGMTMEAKGDLRRRLFEHTGKIPYDDRRSLTGKTEDISPVLLKKFLNETGSGIPRLNLSHEEICDKMRLTVPVNDHKAPRNVALIFFSEDPERFFPGMRIEVVRFLDDAGGNLIDEQVFTGPVDHQVRMCLNHLKSLGGTLIQKHADRAEADHFHAYPADAMEEAIVNAVFHRSYEYPPEPVKIYIYPNRMEITSYPGPLQGIKKEHLEKGKAPALPLRNRRIGDYLKELHMAEARGTGIPKIIRAMKDNGSPPPEFDFDEDRTYFCVTLPIHGKYLELSNGQPGTQRKWAASNKNYVFVFGNVNAGKTTILAGLAKSLFGKYPLLVKPEQGLSHTILQQQWLLNLNNLKFPPRSRRGDIYEIEIGVKNHQDQDEATNLNFLEASGEDLVEIVYAEDGNLSHHFDTHLRMSGIFLVVTPFDEAPNDDLPVWSFFNRLMNDSIDMSRLALVISKWDLNTEEQEIDTFVRENMPQTYKWLNSLHQGKPNIIPFSIGAVEDNTIKHLNLEDSQKLAELLLNWANQG
jgi:predicted HTH transcriptional regulator